MKTKKIEIRTKLVKYIDKETNEQKEFYSYKGLTKKGWYDLRFTKSAGSVLPTKNGTIEVNEEDININTSSKYPTIWIKDFITFEEIKFEQKLEEYFE